MTRTPLFALFAAFLLLSGCSSTGFVASWNDGADSRTGTTSGGWGAPMESEETVAEATTPDAEEADAEPAGACYVKAPNIPTVADEVQVLKRPERTVAGTDVVIPAEYVSVTAFAENAEGFAWLPAICEEDIDARLTMRVQQALVDNGYDIGAIDGIDGPSTQAGLEYFKRDNGLYGEGLTYDVLRALGIDPQTSGNGFASLDNPLSIL